MDDKQRLEKIRDEILDELSPLLVDSDMPLEDKFSIQLAAVRFSQKADKFDALLETARQFEDNTARVNAFMDILEAIDIMIGDNQPAGSEPAEQEQDES